MLANHPLSDTSSSVQETKVIVCDEILMTSGISRDEDTQKVELWDAFTCATKTNDISSALEIINAWPAFKREWNLAQTKRFSTGLRISGANVDVDYSGNRLILPTREDLIDYEWDSSPVLAPNKRKLASNQSGTYKVLVFRVTANYNTNIMTPTNSVSEIRDKIFGTSGPETSMAQQFKACSFEALTYVAATSSDHASIVDGIYDITVTAANLSATNFASVIFSNVITASGIDENDYDYIMFHLPLGFTTGSSTPSTNWVAYASLGKVSSRMKQMHIFPVYT